MARADAVKQPWFGGARTLAEQMTGLGPALAEARGKHVLDLGCAEGWVAREFLAAGAESVTGLDNNGEFIEHACAMGLDPHRAKFFVHDVNEAEVYVECHASIVLALAIFHKLSDPAKSVREWSWFASELLVVRLPGGSTGLIRSKHYQHMTADVPAILTECGFKLERQEQGPRDELVQYWRRKDASAKPGAA